MTPLRNSAMHPVDPAPLPRSAADHSATPLWSRGLIVITAIALTYLAAAVIASLVTDNGEFLFYAVTTAVLALVLLGVHVRVRFSTMVLAGFCLWGAMHMAGGLVPVPESWPISGDIRVLYSWWIIPAPGTQPQSGYLKYDNVVHAFGFAVTAWACWQGLRVTTGITRPTLGTMTLCFAAAMGFGALNEVIEFAATLMGPSNVGGYVNTALDLVYNGVGAVVACGVIYALKPKM